ncbi:RICIN domain-containing protein [Streptomyces sp. NPDC001553]|uniref:RICIN domain-containing protein n=1 Tax=Streptomyces sp. NPDC001553 TaxID=3154385 RepID=UPI0033273B36
MPQQEGGSQMSSPAVRLAAVLPAVPGEPGSALGPRGSATTRVPAIPPGSVAQESQAAAPGTARTGTSATATGTGTETATEVRSGSRPAARTGGAVARAAATWRGSEAQAASATAPYAPHGGAVAVARGDEPPGGRPNKPLLAAAAIAGTVLIGAPFLLLGLGNDDHRNQASVREVPVGGTVLENLVPNGGQVGNDYATAAPTRKPASPPRTGPVPDRQSGAAERPAGANVGSDVEKRNDGRTGTNAPPVTAEGAGGPGVDGKSPVTQALPVPGPPENAPADKKSPEQDKTAGQDEAAGGQDKAAGQDEAAGGQDKNAEQDKNAGQDASVASEDSPALGVPRQKEAPAQERRAAPVNADAPAPGAVKQVADAAPGKDSAPDANKAPEPAKPAAAPKKETPAQPAPKKKVAAKPTTRAGGALPQSANFATVRNVPLKNAMTGMCADVPNYGKGTVDGPVNQFTCDTTAGDNQLWDLVVSRPGAGPDGADLFTIRNGKDGLCLDLPNFSGQSAGTGVSEFHCRPTSADNQLWYLEKRSDGKFWIRNQSSGGKCLDVSGQHGSGGKDARLTIFDCNKRDDHVWSFS